MKIKLALPVFILVFGANIVSANDELYNLEALTKTQNLLKDVGQRGAAINESPSAKKADDVAGIVSMGDAETKNSIYGIAADVMPWLIQQTDGDPVKMMQLLDKAKKDPRAFLESLPQSEKNKIKNLGEHLDSKRSPASSSPRP